VVFSHLLCRPLTSRHVRAADSSSVIGFASSNAHEFHWIYNGYSATEKPLLVAFFCADFAWEAERTCTDAQIVAHVLSRLRYAYGAAKVPDPVASHVTRWGSDPFSRMSYTYFAGGAGGPRPGLDIDETDIRSWRVPVGGTGADSATGEGGAEDGPLGFAGEHTVVEDGGTICGAWVSGQREARRIVRAHRNRWAARLDAELTLLVQHRTANARAAYAAAGGKQLPDGI
jgi:[histone H3]-N6,N6-dimethyl-L-lysine4 FAD-dependent demethylase